MNNDQKLVIGAIRDGTPAVRGPRLHGEVSRNGFPCASEENVGRTGRYGAVPNCQSRVEFGGDI
jgi:hypothetical protein